MFSLTFLQNSDFSKNSFFSFFYLLNENKSMLSPLFRESHRELCCLFQGVDKRYHVYRQYRSYLETLFCNRNPFHSIKFGLNIRPMGRLRCHSILLTIYIQWLIAFRYFLSLLSLLLFFFSRSVAKFICS